MFRLKKTNSFLNIMTKMNKLKNVSKFSFSNSNPFFRKEDMKSKDFLEFLHIPKNEEDIQTQLDVLGKF